MRLGLLLLILVGTFGCHKLVLKSPPPPQAAAAPLVTPATSTPAAHAPTIASASPSAVAPDTLPEDTSPAPPPLARIGVLVPLSGPWASQGRAYLDGAELAVRARAARGVVPAEIIPADTKGEAIGALAATRRLIDEEGVLALLGSVQTLPTLAAGLEANCKGVPLFSNVVADDGLATIGPYVFHEVPSRLDGAVATAELALDTLHHQRIAVLYSETGDGRALALAFAQRLAALGGEVVFSEAYPTGTVDFTPLARRIAAAQPTAVYLPGGPDDLVLAVPAFAYEGASVTLLGTEELGAARVLEACGAALEGAVLPAAEESVGYERRPEVQARPRSPAEERLLAAGFAAAGRLLDALAGQRRADRDALQRTLAAAREAAERGPRPPRRFLVVRGGQLEPLGAP